MTAVADSLAAPFAFLGRAGSDRPELITGPESPDQKALFKRLESRLKRDNRDLQSALAALAGLDSEGLDNRWAEKLVALTASCLAVDAAREQAPVTARMLVMLGAAPAEAPALTTSIESALPRTISPALTAWLYEHAGAGLTAREARGHAAKAAREAGADWAATAMVECRPSDGTPYINRALGPDVHRAIAGLDGTQLTQLLVKQDVVDIIAAHDLGLDRGMEPVELAAAVRAGLLHKVSLRAAAVFETDPELTARFTAPALSAADLRA